MVTKVALVPVADPGFHRGAPTPERSVQVYYFTVFFNKNCLKMKEFGRGRPLRLTLDPPLNTFNISGDFKKEDVARSLLQTCCHHAAITAYDSLVIEGARHIFMAGGFCDHPLVQNLVLEEFENRKFTMASFLHGRVSEYIIIS